MKGTEKKPLKAAVIENRFENIVGWQDTVDDPASQVIFEPGPHRYTVNGRVVPSVTQVLEGAGLIDTKWFTPAHAQRGTDIHEYTTWIDKELLPMKYLSGHPYYPYLFAYMTFKIDYGFKPVEVEKIVVHHSGLWAGTVDREGYITSESQCRRLEITPEDRIVLDIKTGTRQKWHDLQLEGYSLTYPERPRKFCLYIKKDETYRFKEAEEKLEEPWFNAVNEYYSRLHGDELGRRN